MQNRLPHFTLIMLLWMCAGVRKNRIRPTIFQREIAVRVSALLEPCITTVLSIVTDVGLMPLSPPALHSSWKSRLMNDVFRHRKWFSTFHCITKRRVTSEVIFGEFYYLDVLYGVAARWFNTAALLLSENMSSCQESSFLIALTASISEYITNTSDPLKIPLRY